jgi:TolB protein
MKNVIMRKLFIILFFTIITLFFNTAFAVISLELTRGISGALPIAVVPFSIEGQTPEQNIPNIVSNDLQNSGRFKVFGASHLNYFPGKVADVKWDYFRGIGTDHIVIGQIQQVGVNRYQVSFQLLDAIKGKTAPGDAVVLNQKYTVQGEELRSLAHHISDVIYQNITGIRGIFSTRLAYILVKRAENTKPSYTLEVSDQDGYNPKPLLISTDPIMSPAWSPNGKQIAYVSFENRKAAIYIEDVATGRRHLISESQGINGAPAWSPDGRKLALVLSKTGTPNVFLMDLTTQQTVQLTNDFYINTEPSFSPDGRSIIFTSNRSGNPQIYKLDLASRQTSRVTYDGKYNATASFTPDGNHIVVLNQQSGMFNIGTLSLDSGTFRVLTNSGDDTESPSIAPNGSMVLFGTYHNGKSVLGMVATDGSVQLRLPARDGDVQDPAWSPFLS